MFGFNIKLLEIASNFYHFFNTHINSTILNKKIKVFYEYARNNSKIMYLLIHKHHPESKISLNITLFFIADENHNKKSKTTTLHSTEEYQLIKFIFELKYVPFTT